MEDLKISKDNINGDFEVEEEFRSCCSKEVEDWQDSEELLVDCLNNELNENSVRIFFKGVSLPDRSASGLAVIIERSPGKPVIQVQKKLDFYVEELVAEHLALMNGLLEALKHGVQQVFAFTDSEEVYYQIAEAELLDDRLLVALGLRILEHADNLEVFELKLLSTSENLRPLRLAQEAIGIVSLSSHEDGLIKVCPICYEEKEHTEMVKISCSHKFCSNCIIKHVQEQIPQLPVRCPHFTCKYFISSSECKSFLPEACYKLLQQIMIAMDVHTDRIYCPYPDCSMLLDINYDASSHMSLSRQHYVDCIECTECHRFICLSCGVPWHSSMRCDEYQNLSTHEGDANDITWHQLAQSNNWRHCPQCTRIIEHVEGCYHMTCRCGYEFCYACGVAYRHGLQACQCALYDEENEVALEEPSDEELEIRRWEPFDPLSVIDSYTEQERAQLAAIQRFLAGGFGSNEQQPSQSPPCCSDSYVDAVRELRQLPWLESFVSVISDNYHEGFIQ